MARLQVTCKEHCVSWATSGLAHAAAQLLAWLYVTCKEHAKVSHEPYISQLPMQLLKVAIAA